MEQLVYVYSLFSIACMALISFIRKQGLKDIQWDNIMFQGNYNNVNAYCQSKLATILFNLELSKRVKCELTIIEQPI